jgi:DNA integrity scanning protein DisA with diadenylate cyclase activity
VTRVSFTVALGLAGALALAAVATLGTGSPVLAVSQSLSAQSAQSGQSSQQPDMAEMMKRHQQMMANMKSADAKLDDLVATMNAANGEAKVTAIAQVVSELVRQQKTMHEHMGMVDQQMMGRMGGRGMMQGR